MLKELQKSAGSKLQLIFSTTLRLKFMPRQWKIAGMTVIPKVEKRPNEEQS